MTSNKNIRILIKINKTERKNINNNRMKIRVKIMERYKVYKKEGYNRIGNNQLRLGQMNKNYSRSSSKILNND